MRNTPGIQKACEFRYSCLDDDKNEVRVRNVMRTREVSEDPEEEMRTHDIYKRGAAYCKICNLCTRYNQRPMYHKKDILTDKPNKCVFSGAVGHSKQRMRGVTHLKYPFVDKASYERQLGVKVTVTSQGKKISGKGNSRKGKSEGGEGKTGGKTSRKEEEKEKEKEKEKVSSSS